MFIKNIDFLSPPITFYYKGFHSHTSVISGLLSILAIIMNIAQAVYFSLDIINRKEFNAYYFNTFVDDAGIFPFNSSSFFHFISLGENGKDFWREGVDFTKYRIIGLDAYLDHFFKEPFLNDYDHWIYGKCNNKSDTEGIGYLINYEYFEDSACIRQFFNSKEKKYYDTGNPNFKWPIMGHGTYSNNSLIYNIIVETCKQETIDLSLGKGAKCIPNTDTVLSTSYFYFINNYVDVLNYESPNTKFLYRIETGIQQNIFSKNNINIIPSTVRTFNGLIFEHIEESKAYIYEKNDVSQAQMEDDDIYVTYSFWLKNNMSYYERKYKKIQEILSNIGGINQIIILVSVFINNIYNRYIVLYDTEDLLFSSINTEKKNYRLKIKESINKSCEIEKKNEKENTKIIFDKEKNESNNLNQNKIIYKNKNVRGSKHNNITNNFNNSEDLYNNSYNKIAKTNNKGYYNESFKEKVPNKGTNKDINKVNSKDTKKMNTKEKNEEELTFIDFIIFNLFCGKKHQKFKVFNTFRKKIISEGHLMKNHLNVYNLLRVTKHKKKFRRHSYQLKDLIKLI